MVRPCMVCWMHSIPESLQDSMNGYALEIFYESCCYALNVCIWRVWVIDCISIGAKVVMHCMNALRWVHETLWITNGWNDELMMILELFQRLLWMQDSHDQVASRNALLKSKVVWMICLWSKEYLTTPFNCMNAVTIPCNVSMIMIAWSKWALKTLMWLTTGSIWIL